MQKVHPERGGNPTWKLGTFGKGSRLSFKRSYFKRGTATVLGITYVYGGGDQTGAKINLAGSNCPRNIAGHEEEAKDELEINGYTPLPLPPSPAPPGERRQL